MTVSLNVFHIEKLYGTCASGSSAIGSNLATAIPVDGTMVVKAVVLVSHFAGGHQNAGGSLGACATFEGQNGSYSLVPAMQTAGGAVGANPLNDLAEIPPTADTIIAGTGGLIPWTAVWSQTGGVPKLTITNQTGSTAGFDYLAWVYIYMMASQ